MEKFCLVLVGLMFVILSGCAGSNVNHVPTRQADTVELVTTNAQLRQMLVSPHAQARIYAAKIIFRTPEAGNDLYQVVQKNLVKGYQINLSDPHHVDEMSWMCKALISSADTQYLAVLKTVTQTTDNQKIKGHAQKSLTILEAMAKGRGEMDKNSLEALSSDQRSAILMLKSKDTGMMQKVAKNMFADPTSDTAVYDVMQEVLLSSYDVEKKVQTETYSQSQIAHGRGPRFILIDEALSWMCKALGASGNPKYKAALVQVSRNAASVKLKGYARKSAKLL